jgi:hypothetical protein
MLTNTPPLVIKSSRSGVAATESFMIESFNSNVCFVGQALNQHDFQSACDFKAMLTKGFSLNSIVLLLPSRFYLQFFQIAGK